MGQGWREDPPGLCQGCQIARFFGILSRAGKVVGSSLPGTPCSGLRSAAKHRPRTCPTTNL